MDLTDPQQIHGYTYANNNPLTYADPTGMMYIPVRPDIQSPGSASPGQKPPKPSAPSSSSSGYKPPQSSAPVSSSSSSTAFYTGTGSGLSGAQQIGWGNPLSGLSGFRLDPFEMLSAAKDLFVPDPREAISDCRDDFISLGCGSLLLDIAPGGRWFRHGAEALDEAGDAARRTDNATDAAQCNSFVPGTHVLMADGSTKPIEDVQIGDEVLATDPDTGETSPRTVTAEIEGTGTKHLTTLTIQSEDGNTTLTSTDQHPYWSPDYHTWTNAEDLQPGHHLTTPNGTQVTVTAVHHHALPTAVHNLTVEDDHTYYVLAGQTPVLVHNAPPGQCSITTSPDAPVINSKTVFTSRDRSFRIDIENQNPGQPGAGIHLQFMGRGADPNKYYYNPVDGSWMTENGDMLSPRISRQVPQNAINKAYQYFGMEAP
jgi:hypothetical protein